MTVYVERLMIPGMICMHKHINDHFAQKRIFPESMREENGQISVNDLNEIEYLHELYFCFQAN